MKNLGQSILMSILSLIFPALMVCFMPLFAMQSLEFSDAKQFNTIDEAVQWQKDMLVVASKYATDSIESEVSIQSPPTASYSVRLKPLESGFYPEKREFNGEYTPDSAFGGYWAGMIIDGGFALFLMGVMLWCAWTPEKKEEQV